MIRPTKSELSNTKSKPKTFDNDNSSSILAPKGKIGSSACSNSKATRTGFSMTEQTINHYTDGRNLNGYQSLQYSTVQENPLTYSASSNDKFNAIYLRTNSKEVKFHNLNLKSSDTENKLTYSIIKLDRI